MIKLKPCPFCGSEMIQVEELSIPGLWCATCLICTCVGPGTNRTPDQAARAWNKRYNFKTKLAALYGKSARGENDE